MEADAKVMRARKRGAVPQVFPEPTSGFTPWECRARVTDAVLASLSLQDKNHQLPEVMQTHKVFEAFYRLVERYPDWLGCLYFQIREKTYVSRGLEDVLFSLGAFGLITVENHDYRSLRLDKTTRSEIVKRLADKPPLELKTLRKMSNEFAALVRE